MGRRLTWLAAATLVKTRGAVFFLLGRSDRTGTTIPCHGCTDPWPHDAHLAAGALTYLAGPRR